MGKFFSVQMGMLFSGGSCDELYDSVTSGITTCWKKKETCMIRVDMVGWFNLVDVIGKM